MSQTDQFPLDCKVYVGNLGNNGNKTELESAFGYYGPLRSVWVARNPPGFAFVEFEDPRDASDAVKELDGRNMCGCRVRVELSNGEKRSRSRGHPPSWGGGRRPRDDLRRRSPPVRRSSQHPPLLPPTLTQSTAAHFTLSTNQRLYSLFSTQLLYQREQPMALHPFPSFPPKKGRESLQLPLPTSHQATSYRQHLHHVANPLCNSTSLTISLASLRHFYLVQIPQNRGGAAAAAGLFQETEGDNGLSPETRSAQDPSHGPGVAPGLTSENEDVERWFICRILLRLGENTKFL